MLAVIRQPHPRVEPGCRRQRRPPAVVAVVSPAHPRRTPHVARRPAPPVITVAEPATVVERRPAPRVTRQPIPPAIRIDPAPAIAVWLPARIDDYHARLPARPVARHVHPRPVRRQCVVEARIRVVSRWRVTPARVIRLRSHFLRGRGGRWFRRVSGWRLGRGRRRLRGRVRRKLPQALVVLNHRGDDLARDANVIQVNDLRRAQIEGAGRIGDKRQHHPFLHTRVRESEHLRHGPRHLHVGRQRLRGRNRFDGSVHQLSLPHRLCGRVSWRRSRRRGDFPGCCRSFHDRVGVDRLAEGLFLEVAGDRQDSQSQS